MTKEKREEFLSKVDIHDLAKLIVEYNELYNNGKFDYLNFDNIAINKHEMLILMSAIALSEYSNWED